MADRYEQDLHDEGANESAPPVQDESKSSASSRIMPTPTRRTTGPKPGKLPPWKVVLRNDHVNTMEAVVSTIRMLTPLSEQAAVRRMLEAHQRGRALLMTCHRERAELYRDQFKSKGLRVSIGPV